VVKADEGFSWGEILSRTLTLIIVWTFSGVSGLQTFVGTQVFLWAYSTQYMLAFGGMMTMWRKEKMVIMESHGGKM
jgi:hypothetical protein